MVRFGGFVPDGSGAWISHNVNGALYDAEQFEQWYDCKGATLQAGPARRRSHELRQQTLGL